MARVAYYVDDILGEICVALGITTGYTVLGDHYAFSDHATHDAIQDQIYGIIQAMLENETEEDDEAAIEYWELTNAAEGIDMFWSTEAHSWV